MKYTYSFLICIGLISCVEEYDLKLDDSESKIVVEGLITNQPGPYYIRLTKSNVGGFKEPDYSYADSAIPVMDALIIISDDIGQVDTLIPIDVDISDYEYDPSLGYYRVIKNEIGIIIDTIYLVDPPEFRHDRGFYKTNHIVGMPGHTYYLEVNTDGKKYQSNAFMPPVPSMDSLGYTKRISEKDGQEYFVPLVYFHDPQDTNNYYLFQLIDEDEGRSGSSQSEWRFSILIDTYLEPYVNGLIIDNGISPDGKEYNYYNYGDEIHLTMSSMTFEAYNYYKSLIGQFENDGGVYRPAPASPPSNISNNGLGFFRASCVVEKRTIIN